MENDSMQWYTLTGVLNVSPCGSSQLTRADEKAGMPLFFSSVLAPCGGGGGACINEVYTTPMKKWSADGNG